MQRQWLLGILALYLLVILNIPLPNNGGYGFALPYNLTCWISMMVMALPLLIGIRHLRYSSTAVWLLLGATLMTLPALWDPSADALQAALPRLTGLWGGVLFYIALLQVRFDQRLITGIMRVVALAAIVQALVTMVCFFAPQYLPGTLYDLAQQYGPGGFGTFEQRNVNATFLATGLAAALAWLAFSGKQTLGQWLPALSVVVISAAVVLCQSRIGCIGGVTGIVTIFLLANSTLNHNRKASWLLLGLPLLGACIGGLVLHLSSGAELVSHDGSNHQRWLTLCYTAKMIAMHPLSGWGLGTYKGEFQRYMASLPVNPSHEIMGHPHNEVLYQWFEGGIVALLGGLCCVMAWLRLFRTRRGVWGSVALILTLPVLLHTQVEYPLYFSVPHFMLLLVMMRAADRSREINVRHMTVASGLLSGAAVYGLILSLQCLSVGMTLDRFEAGKLDEQESIAQLNAPWLMQWRYQHELTMLRLVRYQRTHDKAELRAFVVENERLLRVEPDDNLDAIQNQVLLRIGH